jgi:exonuclease SbcC
MIRTITLSNYMSHVHTTLDLAPGLTVLVGPNNCGKSAVVSALESLCRNTSGEFMIRHGAKEATVTIETDDGHVITWKRKEQTASYVIDGREVHRLGRGAVPDDLHEKLRLPLVRSEQDNEGFDVHLGHQKEPVFLLDRSASQRATFFASSSDARHLLHMQQIHRQNVQESKAGLRRAQQELTALDAQIAVLEPLDRIAERVDEADAQARAIADASGSIDALGAWLAQVDRVGNDAARESSRKGALDALAPPPALHDLAGIEAVVGAMSRANASRREASDRIAALGVINDPPTIHDTRGLVDCLRSVQSAYERIQCESDVVGALEHIQPMPHITDTTLLEGWLERSSALAREASQHRDARDVLSRVRDAPVLDDDVPLLDLIEAMTDRTKDIGGSTAKLAQLAKELEQVEEEMRVWTQANPTCPTCGAPTDVRELLTRERGHG